MSKQNLISYNPTAPVNEILSALNKYNIPISGMDDVFKNVKDRAAYLAIVPKPSEDQ